MIKVGHLNDVKYSGSHQKWQSHIVAFIQPWNYGDPFGDKCLWNFLHVEKHKQSTKRLSLSVAVIVELVHHILIKNIHDLDAESISPHFDFYQSSNWELTPSL